MTTSKIEWTEQVWNPIVGCTVHSPGCTNCYAMRMAHRLEAMALAHQKSAHPEPVEGPLAHYRGTTRVVNGKPVWTGKIGFSEQALLKPLRRRKPTRYFVNSMSDLFHENVPDEWIDRVFAVMALAGDERRGHVFQVLTKRSVRMREYVCSLRDKPRRLNIPGFGGVWSQYEGGVPKNIWLGVSVEDQARADERIPDLLATPAAIRWISAEPLLGPVNLNSVKMVDYVTEGGGSVQGWESALNGKRFDEWADGDSEGWPKLDWIVCGGESGANARPMHPDWARSLRDQCHAAGVPFFFKQWGEWVPYTEPENTTNLNQWVQTPNGRECLMGKVGKKRAGRLLDGQLHDGFPAPSMLRQAQHSGQSV